VKVPVYNKEGEVVRQAELDDTVFAIPFNNAAVHQAMVCQNNNARQGNACAKTRSEISGSGRKLFKQKGTGRARSRNAKSPLRRGGGVTFGPRPRDFSQDIPKKMRRLAIRCLLSDKVANGELKLLNELTISEPKTKQMVIIMKALGIEKSALIATPKAEENIIKSARNLHKVKTTPANLLNVRDLLTYQSLMMTEEAVRQIEKLWGSEKVKKAE